MKKTKIEEKIFDVNDLVAEELASLSDEELFTVIDHNDLESEKITAPRYSYWQSVFRVFFKKKINIFVLSVFAVLLLWFPAVIFVYRGLLFLNILTKRIFKIKF